jgi:hypothetical protein
MSDFKTLAELIEENRQLGAIVGRLQELHGCTTEMVVHWCEHAAVEIDALRLDKSRLDWLNRNALIRDKTLGVFERNGDGPLFWASIDWDGTKGSTIRDAIDERLKQPT